MYDTPDLSCIYPPRVPSYVNAETIPRACVGNEMLYRCFPLCQRFRKFRSQFKWKGPFRFLPTGIFGITSGGGPLISVGIFRSKSVPFLTNRFFALIREFRNDKHWPELFLLVGAVESENVVPFSLGSPTYL